MSLPSEQTSLQLYGTESLCFDKNDFMKKNFNVDNFVQIHQASGSGSLEVLRDDLGVYLKILRSAMIDLINRDYADFVNLSTNLTGLDVLIEALKTPLGQLREEVLSVEQLLSDAITSVSDDLAKRHTINQQKALLQRIDQISIRLDRLETLLNSKSSDACLSESTLADSSSSNDLVDRLATEVNHLNFLVAQCEGASLLNLFKPRVESICSFVEVGLERGLREGIQGANKALLLRTLRTYASLGTIHHAHLQVRTILRSHLEEVISEQSLRSDPRGLHGLFERCLACLGKVCEPLLAVAQGSGSETVPGYSFLEKSAWPEIVYALETRTQHIFSAGNPAVFHQRYNQSMDFLTSFEKLLESDTRIEAFRKEPDFLKFLDQWNLPVYFQIRYQEIGQVLESSLYDTKSGLNLVANNKDNLKFSSSQMVLESLRKCFDPDVFLLPLLHRFWKLSLLILSRHRTFIVQIKDYLQEKRKLSKEKEKSQSSAGAQTPLAPKEECDEEKSGDVVQTLVYLLKDLEVLVTFIKDFYSTSIHVHVQHMVEDKRAIISDTLESESQKHKNLGAGILDILTSELIAQMSRYLPSVRDTPRIYRRTNKPVPTKHQTYVGLVCAPFQAFFKLSSDISQEEFKQVALNVFGEVAEQYRTVTFEVLSSVHKMEESLRRLKRARDRGTQQDIGVQSAASDDDKIRTQIYLDVLYFGQQVSSVGVEASDIESYSNLLQMTVDAKEGRFRL